MSDDYGYINARIRGMKGRLLQRKELETALGLETVDDVVAFLDAGPYGPEIEKAMTLRKGISGLEEGLRRDLEAAFAKIVRLASDRPREIIQILMGRWEVFNLKTILRGLHVNASLETILSNLVPFGRLDDVALRELAGQKNIKGVIDLLATWRIPYAAVLNKAFLLYREKEDLQQLETALDRAYFDQARKAIDESDPEEAPVLTLIKFEIDMLLVSYALRSAHYQIREQDIRSIFIPGGKEIDLPKFERMMAARDVDDLIKIIGVPAYTECLEAGMLRYLENRRLGGLERAMETCFFRRAHHAVYQDPLSVALVIGYLWLKVNEVVNLRLISRGKHTSMPRAEIEKYLVFA